MPGKWDGPSFIFAYGAGFIFIALYAGSHIYRLVRGRGFQVAFPAANIDLHSDLEYIEAMTAASEAQRASHERSKGNKVSDFFF